MTERAFQLRDTMRAHCEELLQSNDRAAVTDVLIASCGLAAHAMALIALLPPDVRLRIASHAMALPFAALLSQDDTDSAALLAMIGKKAREMVMLVEDI